LAFKCACAQTKGCFMTTHYNNNKRFVFETFHQIFGLKCIFLVPRRSAE
jgi:hypothetical protein